VNETTTSPVTGIGRAKAVVAAVEVAVVAVVAEGDVVAVEVVGVVEDVVVVNAVLRKAAAKRVGVTAIHTSIRSPMTVAA